MGLKRHMPVAAKVRKFPKSAYNHEYLGNGVWRIESRSHPGEHYDVDVSGLCKTPQEEPTCGCEGYKFRGWCNHVKEACSLHIQRQFQHAMTSKSQRAEQ
jgi:hypothetical protein